MLPYRVKSVQVKGPSAARPGETSEFALSVSADGGRAGLHVFRVEVLGPAGESLPWYAANIRAEGGCAGWTIPWALNERPGRYTVQVKDTASGVSCTGASGNR